MFSIGERISAAVESFTSAFKMVTTDHAYIHAGIAYRVMGKTVSLAAGAKANVALTTPADTVGYAHMRPAAFASTANILEVRVTEGETITGGSVITPVNQNRNSSRVSAVVAKSGVTVTPAGLNVGTYSIGSGGAPSVPRSGGGFGQDNEILLKPATTYVFEFENIGSSTATVAYYNLFWYEEKRGV
jgi:hypothetical protein